MRRAEELGYDRFGIWDSPALFREPWVTLASVARDTTRIRLGHLGDEPALASPAVTAACAATLDDLGARPRVHRDRCGRHRRWHLGLGTAKLAELEATCSRFAVCSSVARRLARPRADAALGRPPPHPDHHRGAHASRSLRLAGRIGDGVVVGLGITPEVVASSLELLDTGAREGGRAARRPRGLVHVVLVGRRAAGKRAGGRLVGDGLRSPLRRLGRRAQVHPRGAQSAAARDRQGLRPARARAPVGRAESRRTSSLPTGSASATTSASGSCSRARPTRSRRSSGRAIRRGRENFDGAIDADLPEHEERITHGRGSCCRGPGGSTSGHGRPGTSRTDTSGLTA